MGYETASTQMEPERPVILSEAKDLRPDELEILRSFHSLRMTTADSP
jgi:hypothetical protein